MEFGLDQLRTGLRSGSSYLDMSRTLEPGRRPVRSQIPLRYPAVADLVAYLQRAGIWPITHHLDR